MPWQKGRDDWWDRDHVKIPIFHQTVINGWAQIKPSLADCESNATWNSHLPNWCIVKKKRTFAWSPQFQAGICSQAADGWISCRQIYPVLNHQRRKPGKLTHLSTQLTNHPTVANVTGGKQSYLLRDLLPILWLLSLSSASYYRLERVKDAHANAWK